LTVSAAVQPDQHLVVERARRFVDEELVPREVAAELAGGRLPAADIAAVRAAALASGLTGGLHAVEHGGQGWSHETWALVEEQLGRSTNGISWHVPNAYNVWSAGSEAQIERWLRPMLRGEAQDAYAVTEEHAGSDPSGIATTAEPQPGGGWRIRGEKWFVTSGDVADVIIVVAFAPEGPTLFLVETAAPGITLVEDPAYTHAYPHGHPTLRFDVVVGADAVLGPLGGADELQRAWFVEERLGIAARGIGAMERLLSESLAWATGRTQGGARLWDHQGVAFPLADSAADAAAGRLLVLDVARLADAGADPKLVHAKASMAKLFVSEAACRCADRAVQTFGGRGYRRDNVAERFLRELRVDRIWEGTSEIQRLIIARSLERRGVAKVLR
jgi:alkylation response protein AidB-like acyl-CoA dehydrogenase